MDIVGRAPVEGGFALLNSGTLWNGRNNEPEPNNSMPSPSINKQQVERLPVRLRIQLPLREYALHNGFSRSVCCPPKWVL